MNLSQHPEYEKYLYDKESVAIMQRDLAQWFGENEGTSERLATAVFHLSALFKEYNQVMWHAFPFCQMCRGGCCVVGASEITTIDAAAMTALGHDLPILPTQTHHNDRACIYLGEHGCSWPANWRPLKCMIFYSLGSGIWQLESSDKRYERLNVALQTVLDKHLPHILDKNNGMALVNLAEPIGFAAALSANLAAQFFPEVIWMKNGHLPIIPINAAAIALLAIAELTSQIFANPPAGEDQLLADLEQFEWVIMGRPALENEILAEINGRYTDHTHEHPTYQQFSQDIQLYQQSIIKNTEDS